MIYQSVSVFSFKDIKDTGIKQNNTIFLTLATLTSPGHPIYKHKKHQSINFTFKQDKRIRLNIQLIFLDKYKKQELIVTIIRLIISNQDPIDIFFLKNQTKSIFLINFTYFCAELMK